MITIEMLTGACHEQKELWQKEWPNGMAVTEENMSKAITLDFDIQWFVDNGFSKSQRIEHERIRNAAWIKYVNTRDDAWNEYGRITANALAECNRVRDEAEAEYNLAWQKHVFSFAWNKCSVIMGTAWDEYDRIQSVAWAECNRICTPAHAEYVNGRITAFISAWRMK